MLFGLEMNLNTALRTDSGYLNKSRVDMFCFKYFLQLAVNVTKVMNDRQFQRNYRECLYFQDQSFLQTEAIVFSTSVAV
jgi:hypothetical protein